MSGDSHWKSSSSKNTTTSTTSKEDCSDDELVTWLQYPLEDSFEKSYCSDGGSFRPLPHQHNPPWPPPPPPPPPLPSSSSSAAAPSLISSRSRDARPPSPSPSAPPASSSSSMALCTDSVLRSMRFNGGTSIHSRLSNAKAGMLLQRSASADGALAMGAQRAAGLAPRSGGDPNLLSAKARASPLLQTQASPQAAMLPSPHQSAGLLSPSAAAAKASSSSLQRSPKADMAMRSNYMPSPGALADKILHHHQAPGGGLQHSFASSPWPGQDQNQRSQRPQNSTSEGAVASRAATFPAERLMKESEGPVQVQVQVPSPKGCSNLTEETVWTSSDYVSQEYLYEAQRGSSSCGSFPGSRRFTPAGCGGGGGASSYVNPPPPPLPPTTLPLVLATCSGGSQASADLSPQDDGHKGKRKAAEISECQSEEVDEESVEIKQPQRTSSKRNRAAEVHNLSERNRRNRINEKLKALQDLIPNSTKTDKASVLDEAIEYMKSLQMQLQMVSMRSNMNVSPVMIPVGMPHLQMAPLQTVGLGFPIGHAGMGMAMGMGQGLMPTAYQPAIPGVNHFMMPYQDVVTANEIQGASKPEFPTIDISPQSPEQGHTRAHGMFYTSPHHEQGPRIPHHLDSP